MTINGSKILSWCLTSDITIPPWLDRRKWFYLRCTPPSPRDFWGPGRFRSIHKCSRSAAEHSLSFLSWFPQVRSCCLQFLGEIRPLSPVFLRRHEPFPGLCVLPNFQYLGVLGLTWISCRDGENAPFSHPRPHFSRHNCYLEAQWASSHNWR